MLKGERGQEGQVGAGEAVVVEQERLLRACAGQVGQAEAEL